MQPCVWQHTDTERHNMEISHRGVDAQMKVLAAKVFIT